MTGGVVLFLFWYWIISAGAPGMAPCNSSDAQHNAFYYAPFLNGFNGILGARRSMTAMSTEHGRKNALIKPYRKDKEPLKKHHVVEVSNLN